ncbi:MAG: gliding motility protein GldN [Bacteroidota bacterium]
MRFFSKLILAIILSTSGTAIVYAYTAARHTDGNPHSIYSIPEPQILFRKRIWREMYLREKENKPFFAHQKEITRHIIAGVRSGALIPYTDDTLETQMPVDQFFENLSIPQEGGLSEEERALGFVEDTGWGDGHTSQKRGSLSPEYFAPNEVTTLELIEDVVFDKLRSQLVYDIQAIKLIIPAEKFTTGLSKTVGTFRYKDLATYFDAHPGEAVWVNVHNNAGNIKLTEAFELRLFGSRIVKVENPDDATIEDIYNKTPEEALFASQKFEEDLIELQYFLWEN